MASQNQDIKNAANTAKGAVDTAQAVKTAVKTVKLATTAAKGASGPAGWVMLAAQFAPQISQLANRLKKIAAGIGAYLLYLLLKLALKIAGLLTGLAFGAVSGLPLLAVPVAGPFLYAGWTAYWGFRGWVDPLGTMHLATHPWEIFNKPLSWGKNAFNTVTGGPVEVGGGIFNAGAGVVSTVGSAITSAASAIWGGITSAGGTIFSGLAGGLNFVVGGLTSASIPATAVAVVTGGTMLTIGGLGISNDINKNTAFTSNQQDAVIGGTGDNEIYTISKTAGDDHFENDELPQELTFTIKLTAKADLSNISVNDNIEVRRKDGIGFTINRDTENKLINPLCGGIQTLSAGSDWTCQFKIDVDSLTNFKDSVITNTVTITAGPQGSAPITDTAFSVTTVGSPPVGCPSGWPTDHGEIWQGPMGATSHAKESAKGLPAIDIDSIPRGTPTYTTFAGRVYSVVNDSWGAGYGTNVIIEADCNGTRFTALWAHLKLDSIDPAIKVGAEVGAHQLIGEVDNTGWSEGDHLHYAFNGLKMEEPNIPKNPKTADCNDPVSCDVKW